MQVERTFTVSRPITEVFDYISDFTNTNEWDPGTVETVRTSGEGGLGTTYHNRSEFMGRQVELDYETVEHRRPAAFSARGRNKSVTATDALTFGETGDGTVVRYRATFDFKGISRWLAPLVVGRKLDALADETVTRLKESLERRTA